MAEKFAKEGLILDVGGVELLKPFLSGRNRWEQRRM